MSYKGKDIYECFWEPIDGEPRKHKCKMCDTIRNCNVGKSGYQNLKDHMIGQHPGWQATLERFLGGSGPMDAFVRHISPKAHNVFGWLDYTINGNKPLNSCEDPLVRKYSKLEKVSVKTLKKYMKLVRDKVKDKMTRTLPDSIGLVIDGWTMNSDHYSCLFAVWSNDKTGKVEVMFLSCNVAPDITEDTIFDENLTEDDKHFGFSAADWFDIIVDTLDQYEFEINRDNICEHVQFLSADNCSTNRALSRRTGTCHLFVRPMCHHEGSYIIYMSSLQVFP